MLDQPYNTVFVSKNGLIKPFPAAEWVERSLECLRRGGNRCAAVHGDLNAEPPRCRPRFVWPSSGIELIVSLTNYQDHRTRKAEPEHTLSHCPV